MASGAGTSASSCAGQAAASRGGGHGHSHGAGGGECVCEDPEGQSLLPFVDLDKVRCLNERAPGSGRKCLKPFERKYDDRVSECLFSEEGDAELLLHIPFTVAVKLKSFCVIGGGNGEAPADVRFFVNRDDIDFALAAQLPPTQVFELAEDNSGVIDYPGRLGGCVVCLRVDACA